MKDIELQENVQRKFVRNVCNLVGNTYEERLQELGMTTLQDRRLYLDLIEVYKIVNCISCPDPRIFFTLTGENTRRHTRFTSYQKNIIQQRANLDIRKHFFSQRIIEPWNKLPTSIKESNSISCFKTRLISFIMSTR